MDERLPVLSEAAFGYRQVPQYRSQGSIFPLGRTVELVSETERLIPRTPTHVVIRETRVLGDRGDEASVIDTFVPGVTVRVVESAGEWVLIAVDGARIGWIDVSRLAVAQGRRSDPRRIGWCVPAVDPGVVRESGEAPGTVLRDCERCPEMIVVPAGSFEMGSPSHEDRRHDSEGPVRQVTIPRPFAVGRFEVTREEFETFVEATGRGDGDILPGPGRTTASSPGRGWDGIVPDIRKPIVTRRGVSWEDAREYVAWLSGETRKRYRLPSEAEWEYAARARTAGPFHFGSTIAPEQANFDGNYAYGNGRTGVVSEEERCGWRVCGQRFRIARRARERLGVDGGLLAREIWWRAFGRDGPGRSRRLHESRRARRLMAQPAVESSFCEARGYPDGLRSNIIGIRVARSLDP